MNMGTTLIKQSLRNIGKNKLYTIVNISGLSVSLVLILFLSIYIINEKNIDGLHKNGKRIYRVIRAGECAFSPPFGQYVTDNISGVEAYCRTFMLEANLKSDYNLVKSPSCCYVDSNFFKMFSFPLTMGNRETVLASRNNIVLSESFAKKMFPDTDPLGKTIRLNNRLNYQVSGIVKDFDETTHFKQADVLFPIAALADFFGGNGYLSQYDLHYFLPSLYVLAEKGIDLSARGTGLYNKAKPWYWLFQQDESENTIFQPLSEAYFNPVKYGFPMGAREGNRKMLNFMMIIVVGIFLIALINFINLTITSSISRRSEFGIRKIIGSNRIQIVAQSYTETALLFLASLLLALFFLDILLPSFNLLTGYHTTLPQFFKIIHWPKIFFYILLIYILSATIPALVASRVSPASAIRKTIGNLRIRVLQQLMVVLQFIIATILIISMFTIQKQSNFLQNYETGFNKKETFYICLNSEIKDKKLQYKEELSKISGVEGISLCNGMPGVGIPNLRFNANNKTQDIDYFNVDDDYFRVMQIKLKNPVSPEWNNCWINESAARSLSYDPNKKTVEIDFYGTKKTCMVNEVLPDMNYHSLYEPCKPTLFTSLDTRGWVDYALLRVDMNNIKQILGEAEKIHQKFSPDFPFDYAFMNETINIAYKKEKQTSKIVSWFSLFAILISCMGLFALSIFSINTRTKEIGIRKVNGAKTGEVINMLNKQFIKWVFIAFIAAIPIAWYIMHKWLENFAYKTELSGWIFALTGIITMGISILTVSFQSYKAANRNPIETLRYE